MRAFPFEALLGHTTGDARVFCGMAWWLGSVFPLVRGDPSDLFNQVAFFVEIDHVDLGAAVSRATVTIVLRCTHTVECLS